MGTSDNNLFNDSALSELVYEYCQKHDGAPPKKIKLLNDTFNQMRASSTNYRITVVADKYYFEGIELEIVLDINEPMKYEDAIYFVKQNEENSDEH